MSICVPGSFLFEYLLLRGLYRPMVVSLAPPWRFAYFAKAFALFYVYISPGNGNRQLEAQAHNTHTKKKNYFFSQI